MYFRPLSIIVNFLCIMHLSFADDVQLEMSAPEKISNLLHSMQSCISDIKALASVNMLKLDNMTELMLVT